MSIAKRPKSIVFIDGANIFYTQKHLGWSIDWKKIKKHLTSKYQISETRYYTGIKKGDQKMQKYLLRLKRNNIKTITKPLKIIKDPLGKRIFKANFDVEIATDMLLTAKKCKNVILFSGDSDFTYLIKILQRKFKKKIIVYSSRKTISWEIKLTADSYIYFEDIIEDIKK